MRLMILAAAVLLVACAPDNPAPPAATTAAPVDETVTAPVVSDAWVRQVPPAARMTAGYLKVYNGGSDPLVIVGAESPAFNSVEIHGTVMVDGMARMRHQDSVTVAPGETASFAPGGLHLMLMQAIETIPSEGDIQLALLLADGSRIDFEAPVGQPAE